MACGPTLTFEDVYIIPKHRPQPHPALQEIELALRCRCNVEKNKARSAILRRRAGIEAAILDGEPVTEIISAIYGSMRYEGEL